MLVCQKVPGIRILAETLPRLRRTPTFTLEGGERPVLKTGSMHFSYFSPCKKAESCQDLPNVPHLTTRKSWNYLPNPSSDSAPTSNTPGWSLGAVVWCLLTRLTTPIQIHKTVLLLQVGKEVRGQEREELNITKALQLGAHLLLHEGKMHPSPPFLSLHGLSRTAGASATKPNNCAVATPGFLRSAAHGNTERYATLANIHSDSLPSCLCLTRQHHHQHSSPDSSRWRKTGRNQQPPHRWPKTQI